MTGTGKSNFRHDDNIGKSWQGQWYFLKGRDLGNGKRDGLSTAPARFRPPGQLILIDHLEQILGRPLGVELADPEHRVATDFGVLLLP